MSTAYFRHFSGLTAAVWLCPFRPFFLLTAGHALLAMIIWLTVLHGLLPPLPALGGMVIWHAHELIFGFAVASIAGFLLTAVPEFTSTRPLPVREIQRLVALWLGGRLSFSVSEWLSIWPAALCDSLLLVVLLAAVARPIWQQADRRHLAFIFNLIALLAVNLGFYAALASGGNALGWLRLAIGVLMTLIVVALSRISMRLVNDVLEQQGSIAAPYLARPPRRNLAIFCIALYSVVEFISTLGPEFARITLVIAPARGWVALAATAALANLLNDWHVGRALGQRWVLIPYAVYAVMALGYGLIGLAYLLDQPQFGAGLHLLTIGSLGIAILIVMAIAGNMHSGWGLDHRNWLPLAAGSLLVAAFARAAVNFEAAGLLLNTYGWLIAGVLWLAAWLLYFGNAFRRLTSPRPDHLPGCTEAEAKP